jgi:hypothetical protein
MSSLVFSSSSNPRILANPSLVLVLDLRLLPNPSMSPSRSPKAVTTRVGPNGNGIHDGGVNGEIERSLVVCNNSFSSPTMFNIYICEWGYDCRYPDKDIAPRSALSSGGDNVGTFVEEAA